MNRLFIFSLNLTIQAGSEQVNRAWYFNAEDPNVGGFQTLYNGKASARESSFLLGVSGVDFLSVRGSGHFVPEDKPKEALQMLYNWIHDRDYSQAVPSNL